MRILSLIAVLVILSGCVTPYQSESFSGGFSSTQLDENVFRVSFRGNGYTKMDRAIDFTLLRSAELALENGYEYFVIIDEQKYFEKSSFTTPTTTTGAVSVSDNTAYGSATTYGGQTYNISKPQASNTIVCFKEKPKEFSYNAKFLKKIIKREVSDSLSKVSLELEWINV